MSSENDPVVFSVARNSMLGGTANPVTFDQILVNYYSHYDGSANKFTAPSSGILWYLASGCHQVS